MKNRNLGSILLMNLVLNTKSLTSLSDMPTVGKGEETMFARLYPQDLYARLLSNTDFDALSEAEKTRFLFLRPEKEGQVDKKELHDYEMQFFTKEAHNRTCAALGVPKTNIVFCDFSKNPAMDPTNWVLYDGVNDNIYVNIDKDYSIARPTYLLENINGATRHHSIYQNILKAMREPDALSDREYFIVLTTAIKNYVYQDLRENDPTAYRIQLSADYITPSNIEEVLYSFTKTRSDFQSAGIYGDRVQRNLRSNEEMFHEYMQEKMVSDSLINLEDIFAYFKQSPLNQSSDGMLHNILQTLVKDTAASFYNSIGADMTPGQSITDYIDQLEDELFEEYGIEKPTDEELDEFLDEKRQQEEYREALQQYHKEMKEAQNFAHDNPEFVEEFEDPDECADEEDEDEENDEMPEYKKMRNVLPSEGKIDEIDRLPFQQPSQRFGTSQNDDPAQ